MRCAPLALLLAASAAAQTATVTYELENVWLDPDWTHPWESPQHLTGTFEWTYTVGDFDNGSGEFIALDVPWYGDGMNLEWTIETGQLEIVLPGNWHDWGVDVTLKFTQPLSENAPSPLDLTLSKFEIEAQGINRQGPAISGEVVPTSPFAPYCFGDGSGTACPCGNDGDPGQGCANSTGIGGALAASGSAGVGADDLTFTAVGLPPSQAALLFVGDSPANLGFGNVLGDGLMCVGSGFVRLETAVTNGGGVVDFGPGLAATGGWSAGDSRYFQAWYRDPSASPCGTGSNLTSAVVVTFQP